MKASIGLALIALTVALAGCATGMSPQACQSADWRTVGFEDGVAGKSPAAIGNYRRSCADAGIAPDLDAYLAGRDDGLLTYCQAANGYTAGERGASYAGVCPPALEPAFLAAYEDGRAVYVLKRDVSRLESELSDALSDLDAIDQEIEVKTLRMIGNGLTPEERLLLLAQTREAEERRKILEEDIAVIREELANSRERLLVGSTR